jgi:hypothetical protein
VPLIDLTGATSLLSFAWVNVLLSYLLSRVAELLVVSSCYCFEFDQLWSLVVLFGGFGIF